jgi:hypothetical protein
LPTHHNFVAALAFQIIQVRGIKQLSDLTASGQSIGQSIGQLIGQSIDQAIGQSIGQLISVDQQSY